MASTDVDIPSLAKPTRRGLPCRCCACSGATSSRSAPRSSWPSSSSARSSVRCCWEMRRPSRTCAAATRRRSTSRGTGCSGLAATRWAGRCWRGSSSRRRTRSWSRQVPSSARSVIGTLLGLVAGYTSKWPSQVIMRLADVIMSFPSLLLAVIVLYMLSPVGREPGHRPGHHADPDLPADLAGRGAGDPRADVRAGRQGDGRLHGQDRVPPHPAGDLPDAGHDRDARFRLRDAGGELAAAFSASASSRPRSRGA